MTPISPDIRKYAADLDIDLDTALFPNGYAGSWVTLDKVNARSSVQRLNPVFRDRVYAVMLYAHALGFGYGIGGAARNEARQAAEFLRRHSTSDTGRASRWWNGIKYWLRAGMAPYAPPGGSNHEEGATPTGAIATDMVPAEAHRKGGTLVDGVPEFRLKHFGRVNNEWWHLQPSEWGNSRKSVNSAIRRGERLAHKPFPLPPGVRPAPNPLASPPAPKSTETEARTVTITATLTELRKGGRGRDAARAQALMNAISGSDLEIDGYYGAASEARCKDLQRFFGLTVDGVIGPKTWAVLVDL